MNVLSWGSQLQTSSIQKPRHRSDIHNGFMWTPTLNSRPFPPQEEISHQEYTKTPLRVILVPMRLYIVFEKNEWVNEK